MKIIRNQKGMSLVELLVSVAIASVIIMTAMSFLVTGTRMFQKGMNEVNLQNEVQITLNQIQDILMESTSAVQYDSVNHILNVEKTDGTIEYVKWDSSQNRLYYYSSIDGTESLMADYVSDFSVDVAEATFGKIVVTLAMDNASRTYSSDQTVYLRNASTVQVSIVVPTPTPTPAEGEAPSESSGEEESTPAPTSTPVPTSTPTPVPTVAPAQGEPGTIPGYTDDSAAFDYSWGGGGNWWADGEKSWSMQIGASQSIDKVYITVNNVAYEISSSYVDLGNGAKVKIQSLSGSQLVLCFLPSDSYTANVTNSITITLCSGTYCTDAAATVTMDASGKVSCTVGGL